MKMPLLLLIFFGLYGWIEFEAFIVIGNAVGGLTTFLGIFVTAFIGVALMKNQGASVLRNWQTSLSKGEINTSTLASGASLMLGAILMLIPGYITDFAGIFCFTPGLRVFIGQAILSRFSATVFSSGLASGFSTRFGAAEEGAAYNQTDLKTNRTSSYANHRPLEDNVIEGQFKSKENPRK